MEKAKGACYDELPPVVEHALCWPLRLTFFCKLADSKYCIADKTRVVKALKCLLKCLCAERYEGQSEKILQFDMMRKSFSSTFNIIANSNA